MAAMAPGAAPKIQIPRWMQLVGLPLLLLLAWVVAGRVFHVVFLFLVASLLALLLDPLVNAIGTLRVGRFRIRRGISVAIVYLSFAAALIVSIWALATVVVDQTKTAANRFDTYFTQPHGRTGQTDADRDVDRLQRWLNGHGLGSIDIQQRGHRWVQQIREKDVGKYTNRVVNFVEGAAISIGKLLFALIVVIVASIYMLLDFSKLARAIDRRFPPHPGSEPLLVRMERAVAGYVKGQLLVSLIIGASAGFGMWLLGVLGWVPGADKYALLFGAWVAVTELIPYLGPWLGAIPAGIYAAVVHPISAALGDDPLPDHPPGRGPRRRPERDGQRPAAAPAARDLRPARRRRDLRACRDPHRAAAARRRAGDLRVLLRADRTRAVDGCGSDPGRGRDRAGAADGRRAGGSEAQPPVAADA